MSVTEDLHDWDIENTEDRHFRQSLGRSPKIEGLIKLCQPSQKRRRQTEPTYSWIL